jgi:hypothetical protein
MRRAFCLLRAVVGVGLAAVAVLVLAASGQAAVTLGSDLSQPPDQDFTCGGTTCTLMQTALHGRQLTAPFDGVLVGWRVRTVSGKGVATQVHLRVLRPATGPQFMGAGTSPALSITPVDGIRTDSLRMPLQQNDAIGIDVTPDEAAGIIRTNSAAPFDYWAPALADGSTGSSNGPFPTNYEWTFNADLERDADHDGFGDETQDSCPSEAAVHAGPCQAGSTQVGQWFDPVSLCDQATFAVTAVDSGTSYTVPAAGVLTSWRAQAPAGPHADPMKFKVFHPTGTPHEHTVLAESALENLTGGGLASFPIRVPVQAGDLIGLYSHGNNGYCGELSGDSLDTFDFVNVTDVPAGTTTTYSQGLQFRFDVAATLEKDADSDGFGDLTQDQCPFDATTHGPCKAAADTVAPKVLSLGFLNSSFRAARKGGSIARRKPPVGTRVRYRLSEAATARFTIQRAAKGRKKGHRCVRPTKKNRKAKRCTRYVKLKGSFSRISKAGLNSFRFTGRLRGKKLRPGRYRLVMVATDAAKNKSKPKRAKFRIVLR